MLLKRLEAARGDMGGSCRRTVWGLGFREGFTGFLILVKGFKFKLL